MQKGVVTIAAALLIGLMAGSASAGEFKIENIDSDRSTWGIRELTIDAVNDRDDSVRMDITIYVLYTNHYMSGLEHHQYDSSVVIAPHSSPAIKTGFEIPGSFGRVVARADLFWRYDHPAEGESGVDSTQKIISSIFSPKNEASRYSDRKHSLGPVYAIIDYPDLNFEYPRLMLFLLSRGETQQSINTLFGVEREYSEIIEGRLRRQGLFLRDDDSLTPGILAIEENEAFPVKEKARAAGEVFRDWYDKGGRNRLLEIMAEEGIDENARNIPALQMKIILSLLRDPRVDPALGFEVSHFETMSEDLISQNRPCWIVQGGEFFLPRLCLGEFEEEGQVHYATFSPDPSLPYDKAPVYDMRKAVAGAVGTIPAVEAAQVASVLEKARKTKLVEEIADRLDAVIDQANGDLPTFKPYQAPYLADYIHRLVVGDYFNSQKQTGELDCVQVRYRQ